MKPLSSLCLVIVLASGSYLNGIEQHPFIIRLCAQIVSQLQKFDSAVEKLQTAIVDQQIRVSDTEMVLKYLREAQTTTQQALSSAQSLQAKRMFLLPTYLETAFDHTIDRWIAQPERVPSDLELELIPRYADSLAKILSYLMHTSKQGLEKSFLNIRSTYLVLFSHCVVNSIILSLYTLKTKRHLDRILHRLYMLHALLEEYHNHEALIPREPSAKEAISAYNTWTREVIQRIVHSDISLKNPQHREPWRSKVKPTILGVISSLEKKSTLDKVLQYIVNRVTCLTITKPCYDYINSLLRCIRACARVVPL